MAVTVNIHEAKTTLSRLIQAVENGEAVTIARGGRPVARLVPYLEAPKLGWVGKDQGKIWIADDFDAPLPEFEDDFYK
jgi:prevent-host-death family protein